MINDYIQNWLDVIENMSNENTYKLAWGRSILETIGEKEIDSDITISFDELSSKIIKYYWNQIYFFNLTQGGNRKPLVEQKVKAMIDSYQEATKNKIPVWYEKAEEFFKKDINKYNKQIKEISTILTYDVSWRFMHVGDKDLPLYSLDRKQRTLSFNKEDAISLQNFRFVLSQLLNYRWAQLLEQFNTAPKISSKVKGLSNNAVRRNNLTNFKNILIKNFEDNPVDFYTGDILEENDISVDHVIPWSFMYSDDIWNLVLTSKSNNSKKSNNVPTQEDIQRLKERNKELLDKLPSGKLANDLTEAITNNYVDKFYNSLKM